MRRRAREIDHAGVALACALALLGACAEPETETAAASASVLDPAGWGHDHVGKELPEYVVGDQCLFCHRNDFGPRWATNRHQRTVRELDGDAAANILAAPNVAAALGARSDEIELVLGAGSRRRFLRREGYGRLALLAASTAAWQRDHFAARCAGCHTTGVDAEQRRFSAIALDCYACHGSITLEHANAPETMLLAARRGDPARVVTSICGQCHLRGGRSRSTGLPYPNQFVAGDNLFRDFEVDFARIETGALAPADLHIYQNARDVVLFGRSEITCLSCHRIHARPRVETGEAAGDDPSPTRAHRRLRRSPLCWTCHEEGRLRRLRNPRRPAATRLDWSSATCEY